MWDKQELTYLNIFSPWIYSPFSLINLEYIFFFKLKCYIIFPIFSEIDLVTQTNILIINDFWQKEHKFYRSKMFLRPRKIITETIFLLRSSQSLQNRFLKNVSSFLRLWDNFER